MRLNSDCIRDILLCVEENTGLRTSCRFVDTSDYAKAMCESLFADLPTPDRYQTPLDEKYGNEVLMYHVRYCCRDDVGLLDYSSQSDSFDYCILGLSPKGHDLLDTVRSPQAFKKVKSLLASVGKESITSLVPLILQYGADALKAKIFGPPAGL